MHTPHKKSFAAEELARRQKQKKPWLWIAIGVVMAALVVGWYMLYSKSLSKKHAETETQQIKSIAVLAFKDMTPEKNMEYLGDGMAEATINGLTQIDGFRVPGFTSSLFYKGKDVKIQDIGNELKVEYVLEGSIQQSANILRISAQLIRVADDNHLWSKQYNHFVMENVFAIQDSISYAIVEALKGKLLGKEKASIEKRYTKNSEAYDLYLQGRYFWNKRTEEGYDKALEYFQKALDIDSKFALAYIGIADTYNLIAFENRDKYPRGKEAVKKALELDSNLPEAHTSLGWIYLYFEWDWPAAETEFKRAIEIKPSYATAHHWYTDYLLIMGRIPEALESIKRAREYDPLSPVINRVLMTVYIISGQYEEALEHYNRAIELFPDHAPLQYYRLILSREQGNYQEVIDSINKSNIKNNRWLLSALGYTYAVSGQREKAIQIIKELENRVEESTIISVFIAQIYSGLRENDKAFEWLEKSYTIRDPHLIQLKYQPEYHNIRSDPRFKALLRKMGLPED